MNTEITKFNDAVDWTRYPSAAFALAAVEQQGVLRNLTCRVMLLPQRLPEAWPAAGQIDELRFYRGWVHTAAIRAFLGQDDPRVIPLGDHELRLDPVGGNGYSWGFQDYYDQIRTETGWPGLRLIGQCAHMFQVAGRDSLRHLERRLPEASGGPFSTWDGVGHFLAHSGQPLAIADNSPAWFEVVAPAPVRILGGDMSPGGDLEIMVECSQSNWPTDFHILLTDAQGVVLRRDTLADGNLRDGRLWHFRHAMGPRLSEVRLAVFAAGAIAERKNIRRPSFTEQAVPSAAGSFRVRPEPADEQMRSARAAVRVLHPSVVEKSAAPFEAGRFDDAVFNAFKVVEEELRRRGSMASDVIGTRLVDKVLRPKAPRLSVGQTEAEQEAAHALFRGAIGTQKNPHSHRFLNIDDPIVALEALSLASLLMRMLADAKNTAPKRLPGDSQGAGDPS